MQRTAKRAAADAERYATNYKYPSNTCHPQPETNTSRGSNVELHFAAKI